jgi:hypothetical protein
MVWLVFFRRGLSRCVKNNVDLQIDIKIAFISPLESHSTFRLKVSSDPSTNGLALRRNQDSEVQRINSEL